MFDIPFSELFIIAIVALVVLGPKHLPEVARTVGGFVRRVRRFIDEARQELGGEMSGGQLEEFRALRDELAETKRWAEQSSRDAWDSLTRDTRELPPPSATSPPRTRRRRRRRPATVRKPDVPDRKESV
ncbi:MAG: Sec-independent protein translocase protein TatB [Acidiferrobacteraceae bacterium]